MDKINVDNEDKKVLYFQSFFSLKKAILDLDKLNNENIKITQLGEIITLSLKYNYTEDFYFEIILNDLFRDIILQVKYSDTMFFIRIDENDVKDCLTSNHLTNKFVSNFENNPKDVIDKFIEIIKDIYKENDHYKVLDILKYIPDKDDILIFKFIEGTMLCILNKFDIKYYGLKLLKFHNFHNEYLLNSIYNNIRDIKNKLRTRQEGEQIIFDTFIDNEDEIYLRFKVHYNSDYYLYTFIFNIDKIVVEYKGSYIGHIEYRKDLDKYKFIYSNDINLSLFKIIKNIMPVDFKEILFNLNGIIVMASGDRENFINTLEDTLHSYEYTEEYYMMSLTCNQWINMLKERLMCDGYIIN